MLRVLRQNPYLQFVFSLYILLICFWSYIQLTMIPGSELHNIFSDTYGLIALLTGIYGIFMARRWGGFNSIFGKAVLFFSFGLFAQGFGQIAYSYYYLVLGVEVPYPSAGDIGYFGSIPLYILGTFYLGRAAGVKYAKSMKTLVASVVIPLLMLIATYYLFLTDYPFAETEPIVTFLDFGYPLGQAVYMSLAILVFLLSTRALGGIMESRVKFIIYALFMQFMADFVFLWQFINDGWVAGGFNDFMYLIAYLLMAFALVNIEGAYYQLSQKSGV